jgi:hypothetical protein
MNVWLGMNEEGENGKRKRMRIRTEDRILGNEGKSVYSSPKRDEIGILDEI